MCSISKIYHRQSTNHLWSVHISFIMSNMNSFKLICLWNRQSWCWSLHLTTHSASAAKWSIIADDQLVSDWHAYCWFFWLSNDESKRCEFWWAEPFYETYIWLFLVLCKMKHEWSVRLREYCVEIVPSMDRKIKLLLKWLNTWQTQLRPQLMIY